MKRFAPGARVLRTETGQVGTVQHQFMDGTVSLTFDDGRPADLDVLSLQRWLEHRSQMTPAERTRLTIVDASLTDDQVLLGILNTMVTDEDEIDDLIFFLERHRPAIVRRMLARVFRG